MTWKCEGNIGITSNQNGPRGLNEGATPSDSHEGGEDPVSYLIGIECLVSFVDLNQARDDGLGESPRGSREAHGEGNAANCCVDCLA